MKWQRQVAVHNLLGYESKNGDQDKTKGVKLKKDNRHENGILRSTSNLFNRYSSINLIKVQYLNAISYWFLLSSVGKILWIKQSNQYVFGPNS